MEAAVRRAPAIAFAAFAAVAQAAGFPQIRSGELHPQRIPREYWRHRVQMCKAMGLNTIACYFFWNGIEGVDVRGFLDICKDEGMMVLLRPGPYCCGEWDFGGLPVSMLKDGITIRSSKDKRFLDAAGEYLSYMAGLAEPYLAKNGGPIVMTQLDNEYGSWPDKESGYPVWLKEFWKSKGFGPFYMADGAADRFFERLPYPDPEINVGLDPGLCAEDWACAEKWNPGVFVFSSETYPGWLRHWGEGNWTPNDLRATIGWYMAEGKSFNLFMIHGGTSFGFTAGANDGGAGGYEPDVTSYDYASPISEQGLPTKEYYDYREIIFSALGETPPPVPEPVPTMDIAGFVPSFFAPLESNFGREIECVHPLFFEEFGQNQGMARYETVLPAGGASELAYDRISDYAHVYLDGVHLATLDRRLGKKTIALPARERDAKLSILVEAMGHINYGAGMKDDRKGIAGDVYLDGKALTGWTVSTKDLGAESVVSAKAGGCDGKKGGHFRGAFRLEKTADTFFDMSKWGKGTLYVNGFNLGRYWDIGPQLSLYCPASVLKAGENTVDIVELERSEPAAVRGVRENLVSDNGRPTGNLNNVWD